MASQQTMRAAFFTEFGGPDNIQIGQLPVPMIKPDEVLVRVHEAAVDRVDAYVRNGLFKTAVNHPQIIGRDAWGEVRALGSAVSNFQVGDVVWTNSMGYAGRQGVSAEFVAIPAARLLPMPAIDPSNWLALVHPAATAAIVVDQLLQLQPGKTLLVEGGAGHVGRMLIQCARFAGLKVIATCNPRDFASLRSLGASVIDYAAGWEKQLPAAVNAIVDTSGCVPLQLNLEQLAVGGQIVLITAGKQQQASFNLQQFYMRRQQLRGFVISHASLAELTRANQYLNAHAASFTPLTLRRLPLSAAATAQQLVMDPHEKGRLLLTVP